MIRSAAAAVLTIGVASFTPPLVLAHAGAGIALDSRGRLYFTDTVRDRLWRVEEGGTLALIKTGIHSDVLVPGPDGDLFAQDDYYDGKQFKTRWWRIGRGGHSKPVPGGPAPPSARPSDAQGNSYTADAAQQTVMKIAPDGRVTTLARLRWPWYPTAVIVGRSGELYILERCGDYRGLDGALCRGFVADLAGAPRVQRVSADGRLETVAAIHGRPAWLWAGAVLAAVALGITVWRTRRRRNPSSR